MASANRLPTSTEQENKEQQERKRKAEAANIFSGIPLYKKYKRPKHCDNNGVLKAGLIVEPDGTTHRSIVRISGPAVENSSLILAVGSSGNWLATPTSLTPLQIMTVRHCNAPVCPLCCPMGMKTIGMSNLRSPYCESLFPAQSSGVKNNDHPFGDSKVEMARKGENIHHLPCEELNLELTLGLPNSRDA